MNPPLLSVNNVTLIRKRRCLLRQISWTMMADENWAVLGPNGSGKSLLLQLLAAKLHPSRGEVKVFGHRVGQVNLWELRNQIGYVSDALHLQYHRWMPVHRVVLSGYFSSVGLYQDVTETMRQAASFRLAQMGMNGMEERLFGELSHGEQRKVLLARALVHRPRLLVLDEPCSGLDVPAREEFLARLEDLGRRGQRLLLVTHHIEDIPPVVDHVLLLQEGEVVTAGPKAAVLGDGRLRRVMGFSFRLVKHEGRYWPLRGGLS